MPTRTRPVHALLWFASLGLLGSLGLPGVGCQSLQPETPTEFEALQDASDAHLAYERGDCETVKRLAKPERIKAWEANDLLFSMHLLDGFCKELGGDTEAAQEIYDLIIEMNPNSFAARDAAERARLIRINESDPGYASWMADARERAMSNPPVRMPVERKPAVFPPVARISGIEGYAVVEFGVTPRGNTSDPVIIESKPPFLFDGSVLRAIRQWEYEKSVLSSKNDFQVIRLVFRRDEPELSSSAESGSAPAVDSETDSGS